MDSVMCLFNMKPLIICQLNNENWRGSLCHWSVSFSCSSNGQGKASSERDGMLKTGKSLIDCHNTTHSCLHYLLFFSIILQRDIC